VTVREQAGMAYMDYFVSSSCSGYPLSSPDEPLFRFLWFSEAEDVKRKSP